MPPFFYRREAPPRVHEPRPLRRELVDEAEIISLDERTFIARCNGNVAEMDRLIDLRNAIRPPRRVEVPVIPGRAS